MNFHKNRLFVAIMAIGLPVAAIAQSAPVVVPPPATPGATQPTAQTSAPVVLPPAHASSLGPNQSQQGTGGSVTPPPLIDIAIPAAPKRDAASARDLKPASPGIPGQATKKTKKNKAHAKKLAAAKHNKMSVNPFSGVVGTPVSDSQLNRFVFPEAVEGVFFQEGAPLPECAEKAGDMDPCKPVFLNGKRMMLLQLRAGAKGPVQMLVHMKSGRVVTLNLMPSAGPGAVIRVDGAEDGASDTRLAEGKSSKGVGDATGASGLYGSEQNVEMLSRFARGDIPAGFEPVDVDGAPVRFELFDVIQQASWDNGAGMRAHLFQVKAHDKTPVAISPALFRTENVKALALDRETITNKEPALLYMLEYVSTENN